MVTFHYLLAGFVAVTCATTMGAEEVMFAKLLKRQEPGTPAYNCHDNCGTAITLSKQPNACDSDAFVTNYKNCLQCAGPDNFDIWRYYGRTLSTAGSTCGLETEPKSGKQPEVGPAVHSGGSSSAASEASTSAAEASTSGPSAAPAPTSTSTVTSVIAPILTSSSASGVPSPSSNATASFTAPALPEQSVNAATKYGVADAAGVFGAIFVGAVFGMQI